MFTSDPELAKRLRQIAQHGQKRRYEHEVLGVNSRLDTLQAAILLPKLSILDDEIAARERLASKYSSEFRVNQNVLCPEVLEHNISAWAQYTLVVRDREKFRENLRLAGIPTSVHYPKPLNRQKAVYSKEALPKGEALSRQVLSLPMHAYMSDVDFERIVNAVIEQSP